jgi:nucleotide-binding universal stress UspA family protein
MFERILVPLDGSARAEVILPQLARLLRREDCEILLLRAVHVPLSAARRRDAKPLLDRQRDEALQYVHTLAHRFGGQGAKVHARVAEGPPADAILEAAGTEGATMIALSTHGRSGVARWILGSVAEKVIRASNIPVLVVRSFRRGPLGDLEPVPPQELPIRKILVPTDGSPASLSIVTPAEKVALLFGSEVEVLHVEPPCLPAGAWMPGLEAAAALPPPPPPSSEKDPATEAMAGRFAHAGLKVTRRTTVGDAAGEIIDHSFGQGVDLLAIATHGRSGVSRWMLGSVAERVLRSVGVPVLVVRAPGKAAPKGRAEPAASLAPGT